MELAVNNLDQLGVVAGVLRDLLGVGRGKASAESVRQLMRYSERILERGDLCLALAELRLEAMNQEAKAGKGTISRQIGPRPVSSTSHFDLAKVIVSLETPIEMESQLGIGPISSGSRLSVQDSADDDVLDALLAQLEDPSLQ